MKNFSCRIAVTVGIVLMQTICIFGQDIFIDSVEVKSKYNASYLTSYSSVYLYNIQYVDRNRIEKVIRELREGCTKLARRAQTP